MTLYGALFTGVAGLNAQSTKIGAISDNIANSNTVGYKAANVQFETLVVGNNSGASYSPGGVLANTRTQVEKQGLLLATNAPTDIAMSGDGFFVVNSASDGMGSSLYTRAGSFRADAQGNFANAAGFYLQGWPLDRNGDIPITSANLDSLETVNVESASGAASSTTQITIGANLDAEEMVYPGQGATITMDSNSIANYQISASEIIVPAEFSLAPTNGITRTDQLTINTGNGLEYSYEYGGFTIGRSVVDIGAANLGDGDTDVTALTDLAGGEIAVADGSNVVTFTLANHGLVSGDLVTLSGLTATLNLIENIPIAEFNNTHVVTRVDANTFTFTTTTLADTAASGGDGTTNLATGTIDARQFVGNIFDATSTQSSLIDGTTVTEFTDAAKTFTITTESAGTVTFSYVPASPTTTTGEFSNLNNLALAIDQVNGLTARISSNRLVVGAEDANEAVTFANVDAVGDGSRKGLAWGRELDLVGVEAGARRFSSLQGLNNLVEADEGVSASLNNPLDSSSLEIRVDDPLDTISLEDFAQNPVTRLATDAMEVTLANASGGAGPVVVTVTDTNHGFVAGQSVTITGATAFSGFIVGELNSSHTITNVIDANTYEITVTSAAANAADTGGGAAIDRMQINNGSLLAELGLVDSLDGAAYTQQQTGILGPQYDNSGVVGDNMASGVIDPHFSRALRVFDELGAPHDLQMSFIKVGENSWAAEIYAIDEDDVNSTLPNGQVANGIIEFNGDGTLSNVSPSLTSPISINWTNGALPSEITLDLGTSGLPAGTVNAASIGLADGLSQYASNYNVDFVEQNGSQVGDLVGVTIGDDGVVSVSFSNGDTASLYKLAVADFSNPAGLNTQTGNVFGETRDSGTVNLRQAGENGTGEIVSGALESSNVDLANELTELIVAQRSYQANTKSISTSDELLEELTRL